MLLITFSCSFPLFFFSFSSFIRGKNIGFTIFTNTDNAARSAVFVRMPNHPIWSIKTGKEMKEYLAKNVPQMNFDTLTTDAEMEEFATATPGAFPRPQYVRGLQETYEHTANGKYVLFLFIYSSIDLFIYFVYLSYFIASLSFNLSCIDCNIHNLTLFIKKIQHK